MVRPMAIGMALLLGLLLSACGGATTTSAPQALPTSAPASAPAQPTQADLTSIKRYLVSQTTALKAATADLKAASARYHALASAAGFDYPALWATRRAEVSAAVQQARDAWVVASPIYERMEGIVAGTPALAQYDVDMDAGASAADGGDNLVSFDLQLADGRTLPKPGNLFGVTESTLWGTFDAFVAKGGAVDLDGDGTIGMGDALPDALVLQAAVDLLDQQAGGLAQAAAAWQPTESEAFGALVANLPTVSDFMEAWKGSRFVQSDPAKASRDFAVVSRLSDIEDNITSWETIYRGLSPVAVTVDQAQDQQIHDGLRDLKGYIAEIAAKERAGRRYTPEEADLLSAEAQNRATAITGQISQIAARLNIELK